MTSFHTTESFEIPIVPQRLGGRRVNTAKLKLKEFWETTGMFADQRGCYVFSIRAGRGEKPWYVGKASKRPLSTECFAPHKLNIYNQILGNMHGKPCLSFVIPKRSKGPWPMLAIDEVEEFLIGYAATRNTNLANKRRLPDQKWSIQGVVSGVGGAPSSAAIAFRKLMGIG